MKVLSLLMVLLISSNVYADVCSWNDRSIATRARAFMTGFESVYKYCSLCGDKEMTQVYIGTDDQDTKDKKAIHFRKRELGSYATYWAFMINEGTDSQTSVDLAYLYVMMEGKFKNVGALVGCSDDSMWDEIPAQMDIVGKSIIVKGK
ncbi:MAG: hypothetical protein ISR65_07415 [Bacteriovoracaceae bacterium]|nr:hypothetical protein [Bacteriovoracaceae bacterium]